MSRRLGNRDHRCPRCQIDRELCFCDQMKKVENTTPIVVVMHWREKWLSSNSTNIALQMLTNIETKLRGVKDEGSVEIDQKIYQEFTPLYLFPSNDAIELTSTFLDSLEKPPALIVPDGTWSQTKKFHKREAALKDLQHVRLPDLGPSKYYLRKAHFEEGLSTLEAIARALGIIEDSSIQESLEKTLEVMVTKTLSLRSNSSGI